MSGIGKVYQVVKNIDASDVSKLAKSPNAKKAVNERVSEIGEALARSFVKKLNRCFFQYYPSRR